MVLSQYQTISRKKTRSKDIDIYASCIHLSNFLCVFHCNFFKVIFPSYPNFFHITIDIHFDGLHIKLRTDRVRSSVWDRAGLCYLFCSLYVILTVYDGLNACIYLQIKYNLKKNVRFALFSFPPFFFSCLLSGWSIPITPLIAILNWNIFIYFFYYLFVDFCCTDKRFTQQW